VKRTTIFIAAALALAVMLPAVPANAQASRTFVSAAGSDSNNCANVATPCRHFAAAYAATAPSGEIFVLDPANYGSLTIMHAVSIEGHGWASIAPPNGGNAVTINASFGDTIIIRGVTMDGTGATGGTNGIVFNSGSSLIVADCVMQNFVANSDTTGNGILIQPTSGPLDFTITNTTVSNNGLKGILYQPPSGSPNTKGVIAHVGANSNHEEGIAIMTGSASGGSTIITVANSTATNNGGYGILIENQAAPSPISASIDSVNLSSNSGGTAAIGTPTVLLSRSVITVNGLSGVLNDTSSNTFYTYGDNRINLNNPDIATNPLNTTFVPR
jgi:hypothetical protein